MIRRLARLELRTVLNVGACGNLLPRREVLKLENQGEVVGAIARIGSLLRSQEGVEQRLPLHGSRHLGRHGPSRDLALGLPGGWHSLMTL